MPLDPRIRFIDDTARLTALMAIAGKRARGHATQVAESLAAHERERCSHVPKGLLGPGLACRACLVHLIITGEAATMSAQVLADLHREEEARAAVTIVDFGETWWVPRSGPFAKLHGDELLFVKVAGVRSDVRVQLGVEVLVVDAPVLAGETIPVPLPWLLAEGRRVS